MAKDFKYELWQDGLMVACVYAAEKADAQKEIQHYAMMYRQDGPVVIKPPLDRAD